MLSRAADVISRGLAAAGVRKVFTLSGNQIMPVFDACIDVDIELVHVRHEAAAVYMAEAWAQLTGDVGVALLTAAPGFANGLAPLYSARCSESPVLLISGDAPISQDGMGAFQELDQTALSAALTKLSMRSQNAESVGDDLATCMRTAAAERPGPVHLAIPCDVLNATVETVSVGASEGLIGSVAEPATKLAERIVTATARAERPVVLLGPAFSASRCGDLQVRLRERLGAPVVCMESPRGLADPSLGDFASIIAEADLVVSLGKLIDFSLNFGKAHRFDSRCRFMVVDPDDEALARARRALGVRAELLEQANVGDVTRAICELEPSPLGERAAWQNRVAQAIAARDQSGSDDADTQRMHPATLCRAVQRALDAAIHPILICDGGEFGQWAQAYVSAPTRIVNGLAGAIGAGPCYAVAAKTCRQDATVITLMGDGSAGFHLSEFETALRCNAPFVAVIGHDARWNAEVQIQVREYGSGRQIATDLLETRYDLAVQGLGGYGELVDQASELDGALQRAIASGLPACLNVPIVGLPAPSGTRRQS
jgi:acetolactate synthase-1/2/3 large subunit